MINVLFYESRGSVVVREHAYETREAAFAAMNRARKRGQISAIKGTRKVSDPPTEHH